MRRDGDYLCSKGEYTKVCGRGAFLPPAADTPEASIDIPRVFSSERIPRTTGGCPPSNRGSVELRHPIKSMTSHRGRLEGRDTVLPLQSEPSWNLQQEPAASSAARPSDLREGVLRADTRNRLKNLTNPSTGTEAEGNASQRLAFRLLPFPVSHKPQTTWKPTVSGKDSPRASTSGESQSPHRGTSHPAPRPFSGTPSKAFPAVFLSCRRRRPIFPSSFPALPAASVSRTFH